MTGITDNTSINMLRRALDGLSLRQQVISHNLSNMETPGFKAGEVVFEDALRQAMDRQPAGGAQVARTHAQHLGGGASDTHPQVITLEGAARGDGNTVDIDREMARLAETQIAYSIASKLTQSKFALLQSIVTEGRR